MKDRIAREERKGKERICDAFDQGLRKVTSSL